MMVAEDMLPKCRSTSREAASVSSGMPAAPSGHLWTSQGRKAGLHNGRIETLFFGWTPSQRRYRALNRLPHYPPVYPQLPRDLSFIKTSYTRNINDLAPSSIGNVPVRF